MTDEKLYRLSRRRVLAGLGGVGLASAGAGLGTSALLSDDESFEGNAITAGTLDLKVDWQQTYYGPNGLVPVNAYPDHDGDGLQSTGDENEYILDDPAPIDLACEDLDSGDELPEGVFEAPNRSGANGGPITDQDALISLDDVKPGDGGELTFSMHLCDNPGYVWMNGELVSESENGVTEPEADAPGEDDTPGGGGGDGDDGSTGGDGTGNGIEIPGDEELRTKDLTADDLTAEDLAESLVSAAGDVEIESGSVSYDGADVSAGAFAGGSGPVGINDGVILSSGRVDDVQGPNDSGDTTTDTGTDGDSDLDTLTDSSTFNAAVLEFEFTVSDDADQVFFNYVFGSEEYNEYVGSEFNDVFGFFVNDENVALVPDPDDGTQPAAINNINNGENSDLFVDNTDDGANTEMDGFTVVLDVDADVNTDDTNTLKLAIADTADAILDSWVLIEGGSISTTPDPETGSELPDAVEARLWYDDGDNVHEDDEEVFLDGSLRDVLMALSSGNGVPLDGDQGDDFDELNDDPTAETRGCFSTETHYLGFEWWVPEEVGNEIQSDSVTFDLGFYAEQCRHNDGSGSAAD